MKNTLFVLSSIGLVTMLAVLSFVWTKLWMWIGNGSDAITLTGMFVSPAIIALIVAIYLDLRRKS